MSSITFKTMNDLINDELLVSYDQKDGVEIDTDHLTRCIPTNFLGQTYEVEPEHILESSRSVDIEGYIIEIDCDFVVEQSISDEFLLENMEINGSKPYFEDDDLVVGCTVIVKDDVQELTNAILSQYGYEQIDW